jgi:hypothetical protein
LPENSAVELGTGRDLLLILLLVFSLLAVMWVLARTRRSPH